MSASMLDVLTSAEVEGSVPPERVSETTRYLSAAAYFDTAFREAVLAQIHQAKYRCKAPEFGIDHGAVIRHCRIAERRRKLRDVALTSFLVIVVLASGMLGGVGLVLQNPTYTEDFLRYYAMTFLLLLAGGCLILFFERLLTDHFTIRRRILHPRVATGTAPQSHGTGPAAKPHRIRRVLAVCRFGSHAQGLVILGQS